MNTLHRNARSLAHAESLLDRGYRPVRVHANPSKGQLTLDFAPARPPSKPVPEGKRALPVIARDFVTALPQAREQIEKNALVIANHSGGKDSHAMLIRLLQIVPKNQLVVIHADLKGVEWAGSGALAEKQAREAGVPFYKVAADKSLLDMVQHNFNVRGPTRTDGKAAAPSWPSPSTRQCTSDLKTGPIRKLVNRLSLERGGGVVIHALGLRAQESDNRASKPAWEFDEGSSTERVNNLKGVVRRVYTWLPIHHLTESEVFATIRDAGQQPHWAYSAGNERLSCMFCIMGSPADLRNAAIHNPELFARYVEMERRTGYSMSPTRKPLEQVAGITVAEARALHEKLPAVRRAMMQGEESCPLPAPDYVLPSARAKDNPAPGPKSVRGQLAGLVRAAATVQRAVRALG